jgi:hypothetical protein
MALMWLSLTAELPLRSDMAMGTVAFGLASGAERDRHDLDMVALDGVALDAVAGCTACTSSCTKPHSLSR